jgi:O-antigen/teichoic acid export membrane protein
VDILTLKIISNHSRTNKKKKNVLLSFIFKGISIGISLLLVPLTLNYLDKERYGLWLTLSSIIGWFSLFDIGLGNGLRNKFAEAIAKKDDVLARTYVSTTFALLTVIIIPVCAVFAVLNAFLDWSKILNSNIEGNNLLVILAFIVFVFFGLQFIFKLTTTVLLADQKSAFVELIQMTGQLLCLVVIIILLRIGKRSLLFLGLTLSGCPIVVLITAYFFVFTGRYRQYSPSIKYIDLKQSKKLMGLGFAFFAIQVCSLIVYSSSNIIIARFFSPSEVVVYNIAFKYFSIITVFFNIVMIPFWSAFTEAYVKQDINWIKNMTRKLILLWLIFCLGTLIMVMMSNIIYKVWIGNAIRIPIQVTVFMAIYVCIANWNTIFYTFNSSVSRVYLQIWLSLAAGIVFIPLALSLSRIFGLAGIPAAMGLSILHGGFFSPIQYYKLINKKASGIWNK